MTGSGRLPGKRVLVTGAASGIGRACAQVMAAHGAAVVVTDIDRDEGEQLATEIGSAAMFVALNVAQEDNWANLATILGQHPGGLDVLVNNAGIGIGGDITALSLADWRRQQAINLDGAFLGIKHMLPIIRASSSRGSIINIASVTGIRGSGTFVSYSASKGGLIALTRAVARQCAAANDGVRVNAVAPGIIDTPIFNRLEGVEDGGAEGTLSTAKKLVPLGCAGVPEDIANAVVYLASDDAAYVTGAILPVDGGLSIG